MTRQLRKLAVLFLDHPSNGIRTISNFPTVNLIYRRQLSHCPSSKHFISSMKFSKRYSSNIALQTKISTKINNSPSGDTWWNKKFIVTYRPFNWNIFLPGKQESAVGVCTTPPFIMKTLVAFVSDTNPSKSNLNASAAPLPLAWIFGRTVWNVKL